MQVFFLRASKFIIFYYLMLNLPLLPIGMVRQVFEWR